MPFQEISKEEQRASRDVHIYYDDNTREHAKAVAESAAAEYPNAELHWLECTRISATPGRGAYQNRKLGIVQHGAVKAIAKVSTKGVVGWVSHEPFHWTIAEGPVKPQPKEAESMPCQAGQCDGVLVADSTDSGAKILICNKCGMIHDDAANQASAGA